MKNIKSKKAFTMVELVFVIVIIGILAAVAVPRLAATRDDAMITKAKVLVASVRNALAMERQKRILRGDFTKITSVGNDTYVFSIFSADKNNKSADVLDYNITSEPNKKDKWSFSNDKYTFKSVLGDVAFVVDASGKFVCVDDTTDACKTLTN